MRYFLGANTFTSNAGSVKNIHLIGSHHHPTNNHQITPRRFTFNRASDTICTLTLALLHLPQIIKSAPSQQLTAIPAQSRRQHCISAYITNW
jgi:hypothetical protein